MTMVDNYIEDNCFYVENEQGREVDYNDNPKMVFDDLYIKFKESQVCLFILSR